jgi:chemotaxis protein methyltransferase CheR
MLDKDHIENDAGSESWFLKKIISTEAFQRLSDIVYRESGIFLNEQKRVMLSSRIAKRLRETQCESYDDYIEYVLKSSHRDEELVFMINAVTTNKTDFFREKHHFEYLTGTILPNLERTSPFTATNPFKIWSAGCSSGEEPYTMAFVLSEYFGDNTSKFRILATDLSTRVLNMAVKGIYHSDVVEDIPKHLRLKFMQRGGSDWSEYWRVNPDIRKTIHFGKLNFVDPDYMINDRFHVIFHRNVMIYFDRETRQKIIGKFYIHLLDRGYLFIGHSETLYQISDQFTLEAQTIYRAKLSHHGETT